LPVQAPLAARIRQPINRQHLQNGFPIGAFATGRQALSPKSVLVQLLAPIAVILAVFETVVRVEKGFARFDSGDYGIKLSRFDP